MKASLFFVLVLLSSFRSHDFHNSITEVTFNEKTESLEVVTRVFLDDFELGLEQFNQNQKVSLLKESKEVNTLIQKYLWRKLALVSESKQVKTANFIAYEIEGNSLLLYVEILDCKNVKGYSLYNSILTELFNDQTNLVNIFHGLNKKTFVYTKTETSHKYPF